MEQWASGAIWVSSRAVTAARHALQGKTAGGEARTSSVRLPPAWLYCLAEPRAHPPMVGSVPNSKDVITRHMQMELWGPLAFSVLVPLFGCRRKVACKVCVLCEQSMAQDHNEIRAACS
jgi:hypothetical protein